MLITFKGGLQPMRAYYTILFTSMYLKKNVIKRKKLHNLICQSEIKFSCSKFKKVIKSEK